MMKDVLVWSLGQVWTTFYFLDRSQWRIRKKQLSSFLLEMCLNRLLLLFAALLCVCPDVDYTQPHTCQSKERGRNGWTCACVIYSSREYRSSTNRPTDEKVATSACRLLGQSITILSNSNALCSVLHVWSFSLCVMTFFRHSGCQTRNSGNVFSV